MNTFQYGWQLCALGFIPTVTWWSLWLSGTLDLGDFDLQHFGLRVYGIQEFLSYNQLQLWSSTTHMCSQSMSPLLKLYHKAHGNTVQSYHHDNVEYSAELPSCSRGKEDPILRGQRTRKVLLRTHFLEVKMNDYLPCWRLTFLFRNHC